MKFYIETLRLWLKDGRQRSLTFLPNKVNVVTGDSHTGKTAILEIVDYCFFASQHRISESIINESVLWYGLRIHVNDKVYTIARKAPFENQVSNDYFFSAIGEMPSESPEKNIEDRALKTLLSADFGIDQDVKIPFGGRVLRAGTRISLRYFMLFNTISQDIITHSEQFFDKQDQPRYQEALPRVFDIAVGIDTVENILKREKRAELEKRMTRLQRRSAKAEENRDSFYADLAEITAKAKSYGLIPDDSEEGASIALLKRMVAEGESSPELYVSGQREALSSELYQVARKLRGLRKFLGEYTVHKNVLSETADSLKPVEYLLRNHEDTVRTSVFFEIIERLAQGLREIKAETASKTPLDSNIIELIKDLDARRMQLQRDLGALPSGPDDLQHEKDKYIFIGETKAKLEIFSAGDENDAHDYDGELRELEKQIGDLAVLPAEERRENFTSALDEAIQEYISFSKIALGNYGEYRSAFNYKDKKLRLRKPKTTFIESVGSSSNHMFLHLFLFLGLHEVIMRNGGDHVAPFLIIDQFSRPYWGDDDKVGPEGERDEDKEAKTEVNDGDVAKVNSALHLLNEFINIANGMDKEFQIILFEHIKPRYWESLENFHLVDMFFEGNGLIPPPPAD